MKIYFAGSIRGGREDAELYAQIIRELKNFGEVLTEHIGDENLLDQSEVNQTDDYIFNRDMIWLRQADCVIAEVTTPSLGVGYELGVAESLQKPTLCLFRPSKDKKLSAMIAGNKYFTVANYQTLPEATKIIKKFFAK